MEGLQRSTISFRRQGSSGLVWDDKFLSGELTRLNTEAEEATDRPKDPEAGGQELPRDITGDNPPPAFETAAAPLERNRSTGGGGGRYRTERVTPTMDPPSPKVSACGFCRALGKQSDHHAKKKGKHGNRRRTR
ncbi:hypothetical protein SAY86_026580 [Trapa natans]|uniref:MAPK kinase substrate protein At1g80180-like n=1 Tax=Trapa natans TaxID=22666 RepID=A0AAN7KLV0_TRANT|nr:hypothetical protein SAY86_026580 [Trapa natans]